MSRTTEYEEQSREMARYILEKDSTVRAAAKEFGLSKSTIHKRLTETLPRADVALAEEVKTMFRRHTDERAMRGGMATKMKWLNAKKSP